MKTIPLFIILSVTSLLIMIAIDNLLGEKAEFINAWSVIERLFGRPPSAGDSAVYLQLGAIGELVSIGLIHGIIGGVLTFFAKSFLGK